MHSLTPQLYFKYPENSQIEKGREDVFEQFAFPFGVETKQINLTDSLSQLNEIIFSNNIAEANNNCFVFAIKSEESYKVSRFNNRLAPFNEHQELLEICNPSNLLYGICFRFKEVIENGSDRNCWTTNKVFCFLTYYPFHRFFLEIIASMLNQMKMQRIQYFSNIQDNIRHDTSTLSKLENEFFQNFLNRECKEVLEALKKIALPRLSSSLELNFNGERFIYNVPSRESAKHIEAEWGCSLVLSSFEKELFVRIFLSLLLEQSIVFVSSNSALLSSTMLLFHSLLKPFKWHHPLVFNLPNNFTHLMDIPVPILVGLNQDKLYVQKNLLAERHENCLFLLLDDNFEMLNHELTSHIDSSYLYQQLVQRVSPYFDTLQLEEIPPYHSDLTHNFSYNSSNKDSSSLCTSNSSVNTQNGLANSQKRNNFVFASRAKSSVISAATDAFSNLIGSKNKNYSTLNHFNSLFSSSTHRKKKAIIAHPNMQEKETCLQILSTCTNFLTSTILVAMPHFPPLKPVPLFYYYFVQNIIFINQKNSTMLNFDAIEAQMGLILGKNDSFLQGLLKTQLFTVFAEEKYLSMNI